MHRTLQGYALVEGHVKRAPLAKGLGWGLIGGLAGTLAMDILLMGVLWAVRYPALLCFTIVGDTLARVFSMLGMEMAGGVPTGIVTHYVIGPLVGILFGAAAAVFPALREGALKKIVIASVLYVQILSQPILALTPILLKMTALEVLQWYCGAFAMHLVAGIVLGVVVGRGLRPAKC